MAYYITNTQTNKINPNAILSEVALFETEEDFLIAKQQWVSNNTIIEELSAFDENGVFIDVAPENSVLQQNLATLPLEYETITKDLEYEIIEEVEQIKPAPEGYIINEELALYESVILKNPPLGYKMDEDIMLYIEIPSPTNTKYIKSIAPNIDNYLYAIATEDDKRQYIADYLKFKKQNETRENVVVCFKPNPSIENTAKIDIDDYLLGQIQEEVAGIEYMYVEASGDLLATFIENEQAIIDNEKNIQIKDLYDKTVAKVIATQNEVLSNLTGIINGVTLNKLSVDRLIELCTLIDKSDEKVSKLFSSNCAVYFNVDKKDIGRKYLTIVSTIKQNVYNNSAKIISQALTLASNKDSPGLEALFDSVTPELLDGDNVKDGKMSIDIDDNKIQVFNSATGVEITKDIEETQRLINLVI